VRQSARFGRLTPWNLLPWLATSTRPVAYTASSACARDKSATEYFDKYRFESQPDLLRRVAEAMVPLLPHGTELLGGLELGGVPIATMVSSLTGLPALFVRKQAKTYGTCRLAKGGRRARSAGHPH